MARRLVLVAIAVATLFVYVSFVPSQVAAQDAVVHPPLKIVHIGDSYSAGNGARTPSGDRNYYGPEDCFRSYTNWGWQYAEQLSDSFTVQYINRACSGAVIDDILNPQDVGPSILKGLDGLCPTPVYVDEEFYVEGLLTCQRFVLPQIRAVDESVDLVLMSMGGNDVDFANIVAACLTPGVRGPVQCEAALLVANLKISNIETKLTSTFAALNNSMRDDARIVLVSYPHLVPKVNLWLSFTDVTFTYAAGIEIRRLALEGDRRQSAAIAAANAAARREFVTYFDDTKELFANHLPEPIYGRDYSGQWLHGTYDTRKIMEWYHYNPGGHENLANALAEHGAFGATGKEFENAADIDIAFVVDTTGSMSEEIAEVRSELSQIVDTLATNSHSFRVAVVSYRDFPERTGEAVDYPAKVHQTFTNDVGLIEEAIESLNAAGGGDANESMFSGIQAALRLPWRPGVTKVTLVLGDAPALSPEPITNLTFQHIVENSIAIDPVQAIGVDVGSMNANGALGEIAQGTGGSIVSGTDQLVPTILDVLEDTTEQPFAWIGAAYSGKIGEPILLDASGSYDPSGAPLSLYEWDFDGDGVFDQSTTTSKTTHVYASAFEGYVVARVTGSGGSALASARTVVNVEGYALQGDEEPCELDSAGYSIVIDENGEPIPCTADHLRDSELPGVAASSWSPITYLPAVSTAPIPTPKPPTEPGPNWCTSGTETPIDLVVALDRSSTWAKQSRMEYSRQGIAQLVNSLDLRFEQASLVSFDEDVVVQQPLSIDRDAFLSILMSLEPGSGSALGSALWVSGDELKSARHKPSNLQLILFITDGDSVQGPEPIEVARGLKESGIRIVTVSAGDDVEHDVMAAVASQGTDYYYSANATDLPALILAAVQKVRCGG